MEDIDWFDETDDMESLLVKDMPPECRLGSLLLLMLSGSGTGELGTSHGLKPSSSIKSSIALMMRFVVFWAIVFQRG